VTLGLPITVASIEIFIAANETLLYFLTWGLLGLTSKDFLDFKNLTDDYLAC
jgi:hypothetical protein